MNIAWELFINLLEVAIIYDFLIRYLGYRTEKKGKYVVLGKGRGNRIYLLPT